MLRAEDRVTARQFYEEHHVISCSSKPYLLIDVRPQLEASICHLPDSINFPYQSLDEQADQLKDLVGQHLPPSTTMTTQAAPSLPGLLLFFFFLSLSFLSIKK